MSKKGIIFNIQHFSVNDGPGIRTTLFLKGCPLRCWWCHNPEGISPNIEKMNGHIVGVEYDTDELLDIILKDRIFYDQSGGGVTFSGGEPVQQIDFLEEILSKSKAAGLHTTVDTSGYSMLENFKRILKFTDLFLFDLKFINNNLHEKHTGVSNTEIIANLQFLLEEKQNIIIRIPLIPLNDQKTNISKIVGFLKKLNYQSSIHLLPFHKIAESKYMRYKIDNRIKELHEMAPDEITNLANNFIKEGWQVNIGG